MTKVIASEDCGNSPKKYLPRKLTIAFAKGNSKFILSNITDDIRWNIIGNTFVQGKDNFAAALERMKNDPAIELTMHHIATHGKAGAVNGTIKLKNGKTRAFCDVYEFRGAKGTSIKEITSYVIEVI